MIQARSADGVMHQFPDGTSRDVINRSMKAYADALPVTPGAGDAMRALMNGLTFNNGGNFNAALNAAGTGLRNAFAHATGRPDAGYGMADAWNAAQQVERNATNQYAVEHPVQSVVASGAGATLNPINQAAGKFTAAGSSLPVQMVRGAVTGAPIGAAYGYFGADPGHRMQGAANGAMVGGAFGAASPMAGRAADAAGKAMQRVGSSIARMTGQADPQRVAAQRLADALSKDIKAGVDPVANVSGYAGVSQPSMADVAGENLRAATRDAAMQGPARQTMQAYRDRVASDLQNNALNITANLTPGETRTPQQLAEALRTSQVADADRLYPAFSGDRIPISPDVASALGGKSGAAALAEAINLADARRDPDVLSELLSLRQDNLPPDVGAGTLDLVRRGIRDSAGEAFRGGHNTLAGGLGNRASDLEAALMQSPGFDAARNNFQDWARQIDAIDLGRGVTNAAPSQFAADLQGANPAALQAAGVGARDALATAIGGPTEGAIGRLNQLSTNTNTGLNMGQIYGQPATDSWRAAIQAEADRMSNANFMAPNTGSQTLSRAHDGILGRVFHGAHIAKALANAIMSGGPLSDAERSAITGIALQPANDDLVQALMAQRGQPLFSPYAPYVSAPATAAATGANR